MEISEMCDSNDEKLRKKRKHKKTEMMSQWPELDVLA
jgi:hypothetical protein